VRDTCCLGIDQARIPHPFAVGFDGACGRCELCALHRRAQGALPQGGREGLAQKNSATWALFLYIDAARRLRDARRLHQDAQQIGQLVAHFAAIDDQVDGAVLEQEF